ncbi:alpha/beta fold hydrolase [Enhygromyxa salina]|uniref:Non-heme chloroperoxidase n=1 Tax=Enhygromyxa salina TaxID=215803 RepID=A0A2S9YYF3_9BACT|nr:alpha/beta hydrolase [Enhygromyxa salina]PRQ10135.1 Non-heme chloroperoxidase [Enhygromyxa salina]
MPSYTTPDGLNISYRVVGEGEPVVLVHGWMVGGAIFDAITPALVGAGKQVIIPDQRGVGDSAQPPTGYTLDLYARDLIELVNAAGLKRFKLLGHSMGGQIAQLVAAALGDRVQTMVLLCSVPAAGVPLPDEMRQMFRSSGGNPEAQTKILQTACKQLDDAGLATILATAATVFPNCVAESFDAWTGGGFEKRLAEITCEKTYVIGTDDPFLPREVLEPMVVQPIENAEFVYMPGPGHYPQIEATQATAAKLVELL